MNNKFFLRVCSLAFLLTMAAGCSRNMETVPEWDQGEMYYYEDMDYSAAAYEPQEEAGLGAVRNDKLIKTGDMAVSIASEEFDAAVPALRSYTEDLGGYVQYYTMNKHSAGGKEYRVVSFTLRIPYEYYEEVKDYAQSLGKLEWLSDSVSDVTDYYYDTQTRLAMKEVERDRLLALLETAQTIEDIIAIESRLSDVNSEIEILEWQLKDVDSKVAYATLGVDMTESFDITLQPVDGNLGSRIKNAFISSLNFVIKLFEAVVLTVTFLLVPGGIVAVTGFAGYFVWKKTKRS